MSEQIGFYHLSCDGVKKMGAVRLSEIAKAPGKRMDPAYHLAAQQHSAQIALIKKSLTEESIAERWSQVPASLQKAVAEQANINLASKSLIADYGSLLLAMAMAKKEVALDVMDADIDAKKKERARFARAMEMDVGDELSP